MTIVGGLITTIEPLAKTILMDSQDCITVSQFQTPLNWVQSIGDVFFRVEKLSTLKNSHQPRLCINKNWAVGRASDRSCSKKSLADLGKTMVNYQPPWMFHQPFFRSLGSVKSGLAGWQIVGV